jgi:hypothetical protein
LVKLAALIVCFLPLSPLGVIIVAFVGARAHAEVERGTDAVVI